MRLPVRTRGSAPGEQRWHDEVPSDQCVGGPVKISDVVVDALYQYGVRRVFEMSGGMITHLLDSIYRDGRIRLISTHHEQAAAFCADVTGRLTGVPGVALATSGPGATNLLTGIGSCHFDSSPAVFITGQVNRSEQKGARPIRQLGFQETDIVAMAGPITKASWRVTTAEDVPHLLRDAFELATAGRPGPVLLDIPMDVQRTQSDGAASPLRPPTLLHPKPGLVDDVLAQMAGARRPLLLAGGGVRAAGCHSAFREFASRAAVPVVCSLMGVDVVPFEHPLRVGMIGTYGNRWANLAIARCDFLLVIGSRLDIRQTGADVDAFAANKCIVHVDCEPGEINNRVPGCVGVEADIRPFLEEALARLGHHRGGDRSAWRHEVTSLKEEWPDSHELSGTPGINPNEFLHVLSKRANATAAFVVDVGQHQMWAAQSLELGVRQRFLTSGGMGAMGFGLPAAVGAALELGCVVMIAGDGGFQTNIQELETVRRNGLPLKMVILNNRCHGMVRQFQESYFEGRYQSTMWGYSAPNFVRVAEAYGIRGMRIESPLECGPAVEWLFADPAAASLLEVRIDSFANAYPKIAFGRPISEMEPFAVPIAEEST